MHPYFKIILILSIIIAAAGCSVNQPSSTSDNPGENTYAARGYYYAKLELPGWVLHGAGQSQDAFYNYSSALGTSHIPAIYKVYLNFNDDISSFFANLGSEMKTYYNSFGVYLIPEIGLQMTTDGNPSAHYEQNVAAGLYDGQIDQFCEGLALLGHPAYVRIGYEFNGIGWNGYLSNNYKQAYIRITDKIRARNLEAATVWCCAAGGPMDIIMDYYPGDSYVDWWGIDLFAVSELTASATLSFFTNADAHGKPVMIPECTPCRVGVLNGALSWNTWFKPFFSLVQTYSNVKAFCYIDWNWASYPQWADWGDARIEQNPYVKDRYHNEIASPLYFNAVSEIALRTAMGTNDFNAPTQVTGIQTAVLICHGCRFQMILPSSAMKYGATTY